MRGRCLHLVVVPLYCVLVLIANVAGTRHCVHDWGVVHIVLGELVCILVLAVWVVLLAVVGCELILVLQERVLVALRALAYAVRDHDLVGAAVTFA